MHSISSTTRGTCAWLGWVTLAIVLAVGHARRVNAEAEGQSAGGIAVSAPSAVDAGRYLVTVAGCNDCHTPGFMQRSGNVSESEWLVGSSVGWQGPWGTTYASNLRLLLQDMDEDTWVEYARIRDGNPPMPWWTLKTLSDKDLRSIYQYVKTLPVKGAPAPAFVPPGQPVTTPYISMEQKVPADKPAAGMMSSPPPVMGAAAP